jgi:formylmethanofuran dehydrogenase subunit A
MSTVPITVDVGQVVFGDTTSMTADGAVGQFLHDVTGRKWMSQDIERETGCGVVPIEYENTNLIHALQWAIGLEWFLRVDDPWKIAMSTDHPNGGSFLAYPEIIAMLMSRDLRNDALKLLPDKVRSRSGLGEIAREYSLTEIAIITRSGPARILGMPAKGHLGIGAGGDVTIYAPSDDPRAMFAMPRYVIKAGHVVIDDGALREPMEGATMATRVDYDRGVVPGIRKWFDSHASIRFANFCERG